MQIKQFFLQALDLDKQIKAKQAQIQQRRDMQTDVSKTMQPDKVQTTKKNDRLGDITAALLDLIDSYARDVTRLLRMKYDIKIIIDRIENADYRTVLEWRYASYLKWEDIAEKMHMNERYIHKLHQKALVAAEKTADANTQNDANNFVDNF
ncbi:MAG: DUF1492 domain-containing protein [Clostridiales bacterium]|nr:DUF1492 domain-containing protein [Clostridiales bacterium]